jgi:cytochrome P450
LLDAQLDVGHMDIVEDFSIKLPLDVIGELLDIPEELRPEVHRLSDLVVARMGGEVVVDDAIAGTDGLRDLFAGLVAERRRSPGDDIITLLMKTPVEDAEGNQHMLTDNDLAYRFMEMAFAGHETVAKLIPNAVIGLAWFPDQRARLANDPSLGGAAVEEFLRWDPPSHYQGRWTLRESELHGVKIPADKRVVLITGAAVHDDRVFDNPGLLNIERTFDRHVSFGFGIHLCLGAALARLETRLAMEELLARIPEYDLDSTGVARAYSGNVRGLAHLPVSFDRATAAV